LSTMGALAAAGRRMSAHENRQVCAGVGSSAPARQVRPISRMSGG
jgi:hypothetical protein